MKFLNLAARHEARICANHLLGYDLPYSELKERDRQIHEEFKQELIEKFGTDTRFDKETYQAMLHSVFDENKKTLTQIQIEFSVLCDMATENANFNETQRLDTLYDT